MQRRRSKGRPIDGWVILDKPLEMTSTQAVAVVKRVLNAAKAGHAGTLDPLATGLLPIALGAATKTIPYVMDGQKTYRFTLRFGEARTTDDAEGDVIATSLVRPTDAEIEAVLPRFTGVIDQVPPKFSAIKVAGQRAYDLARADQVVELAARPIRIDRISLVERPDADHAVFEVESGKGAYMRSLARDLAQALGSVGYVSALRRLRVGPFSEDQAISLEVLKEAGHSAAATNAVAAFVLPVTTALDDIPALAITKDEARLLRNGQALGLTRRADFERVAELEQGSVLCAVTDARPVALVRYEAGQISPVRVLSLT